MIIACMASIQKFQFSYCYTGCSSESVRIDLSLGTNPSLYLDLPQLRGSHFAS
jgi:hypothetical protein